MKNYRLLLVAAASLTVMATSAIALSQTEGSHWTEQRMAQRVIGRFEARLNLTSAQREQAKAILKTEEPTILALAAEAKLERDAMTALPAYNEAEVREIAAKYAATNTDIVVEKAKVRLELRAILTPAQLEQLEALKGKADGRFADRLDSVIDAL